MKEKADLKDVKDNKIFALLAYLSVFCIIPLILRKDNTFVMEHGKQGLILFIAETAIFILHILLGAWFLKVGIFVLGTCSLAGMVAVLQGRSLEIPGISTLAKNITL